MRAAWALLWAASCGGAQSAGGGVASAACDLAGAWVLTISNAKDPCGASEPGEAATLRFRTTGIGAVIDADPPMPGWSMDRSSAGDCRFVLRADKSMGASHWAEFTLLAQGEVVTGAGETQVAMASGGVCTVLHQVRGTKR